MRSSRRPWSELPRATLFLALFGLSLMAPVTQSAPAQKKASPAALPQETKNEDIKAVRSQLLELLRLSPKLTMAISDDPTLLTDEPYVSRNNPQLIEFLHDHPEVARNPEFYLFFPNKFPARIGRQRFEATVWPELQGFGPPNSGENLVRTFIFLVIISVLVAFLWIFRNVLENIRWNKLFRMQNDLYTKLLEKYATNEELLASLRTSTGKPFFDLSAIEPRSSPMTRVFLPLQFGIVLAFVGGTLLFLRNSAPTENDVRHLVVLGALAFTLGVGFVVSAAASYLLARHLGLLPQPTKPDETRARS
ncbi:MAG TPA: hypothetical protein VKB90_00720 [Candidatus Acidoferrum sp.]|nr:hypothetical protein [Candidatus Acidoferrum sp.]